MAGPTHADTVNARMTAGYATTSGTEDPTVIPGKLGPKGSVYYRMGAQGGAAYVKQDEGLSTNWTLIPLGATPQVYPKRATLWTDESDILLGNPIVFSSSGQNYGGFNQSPSANGDSLTNSCLLAAGAGYVFSVLGVASLVSGIVDWYMDGVLIHAGQDWYVAGSTLNVIKTFTFNVAADGLHVFKSVINGKNAASSNFIFNHVKAWIKPAAD